MDVNDCSFGAHLWMFQTARGVVSAYAWTLEDARAYVLMFGGVDVSAARWIRDVR